jgi:hypothetical protein
VVTKRFWSRWPRRIPWRAATLAALIVVVLSSTNVPVKIADRVSAYFGTVSRALWPVAVILMLSILGTAIGLLVAWSLWIRGRPSEAVA